MLMGKVNHRLKLLSGEWEGDNWARILFNLSLRNLKEDYTLKIIHRDKAISASTSFIDPEDENSLIFVHHLLQTKTENFKDIICESPNCRLRPPIPYRYCHKRSRRNIKHPHRKLTHRSQHGPVGREKSNETRGIPFRIPKHHRG